MRLAAQNLVQARKHAMLPCFLLLLHACCICNSFRRLIDVTFTAPTLRLINCDPCTVDQAHRMGAEGRLPQAPSREGPQKGPNSNIQMLMTVSRDGTYLLPQAQEKPLSDVQSIVW